MQSVVRVLRRPTRSRRFSSQTALCRSSCSTTVTSAGQLVLSVEETLLMVSEVTRQWWVRVTITFSYLYCFVHNQPDQHRRLVAVAMFNYGLLYWTTGIRWLRGVAVGRWGRGFDSDRGIIRATTLGKLFIYLFIYLRTQHSKQYKIEDTIKAVKF